MGVPEIEKAGSGPAAWHWRGKPKPRLDSGGPSSSGFAKMRGIQGKNSAKIITERIDIDYGKSKIPLEQPPGVPSHRVRTSNESILMKDKSQAVLWICFTLLVAAGIKYVPPYLIEQRRLDMQERLLNLREDSFLHQKPTPTVSDPGETHANRSQLL